MTDPTQPVVARSRGELAERRLLHKPGHNLYLPGVARHQLRAADQCPWELQPLVELLYRGTIWTHPNGRDWSLEAFFQTCGIVR